MPFDKPHNKRDQADQGREGKRECQKDKEDLTGAKHPENQWERGIHAGSLLETTWPHFGHIECRGSEFGAIAAEGERCATGLKRLTSQKTSTMRAINIAIGNAIAKRMKKISPVPSIPRIIGADGFI